MEQSLDPEGKHRRNHSQASLAGEVRPLSRFPQREAGEGAHAVLADGTFTSRFTSVLSEAIMLPSRETCCN